MHRRSRASNPSIPPFHVRSSGVGKGVAGSSDAFLFGLGLVCKALPLLVLWVRTESISRNHTVKPASPRVSSTAALKLQIFEAGKSTLHDTGKPLSPNAD